MTRGECEAQFQADIEAARHGFPGPGRDLGRGRQWMAWANNQPVTLWLLGDGVTWMMSTFGACGDGASIAEAGAALVRDAIRRNQETSSNLHHARAVALATVKGGETLERYQGRDADAL